MNYQEQLDFINETELTIVKEYGDFVGTEENFGIIYDTKEHEGKKEYTVQKYGTIQFVNAIYEETYEKLNDKGFTFKVLEIDNKDIKWLEAIVSTSLSQWIPRYIEKKNIIEA